MAALTDNRSAYQLDPVKGFASEFAVLDTEIIYSGSLVARDYADEIQAASDTEGLQVIGVRKASGKVDNSDDGETAAVSTGVFLMENSSSYPLTLSSIGLPCYVEDDQTVAGYSTELVAAGIVRDVTDDGVLVDVRVNAVTLARDMMTPPKVTAVDDDKTATAAECFSRRNIWSMADGDGDTEIVLTLPAAVSGMKFGVNRSSSSAGDDVGVQCNGTDKIEGTDAWSAAGKRVLNDTDAVSAVIWWECVSDGYWQIARPLPAVIAEMDGVWEKDDT